MAKSKKLKSRNKRQVLAQKRYQDAKRNEKEKMVRLPPVKIRKPVSVEDFGETVALVLAAGISRSLMTKVSFPRELIGKYLDNAHFNDDLDGAISAISDELIDYIKHHES